jgi:hypothetical protein
VRLAREEVAHDVGYPQGKFGPLARKPVGDVAYFFTAWWWLGGVIHRGPRGCFCATASAAAFSSASMTIEIRVPAPGLDLRVPAPAACARVNSARQPPPPWGAGDEGDE